MSTTRAKFGYLTESDMMSKITSGILDSYDIVYTKDTNLCYIIDDALVPQVIRSRVYTFDTTGEAATALNENSDTYEGQIVSIKHNDGYRAYIVKKNNGIFVVSPVAMLAGEMDFNDMLNRPITNLTGTITDPVLLSDYPDGIYAIKGQYRLFEDVPTIFPALASEIFIKEGESITKYASGEIVKYTTESVETPEKYVTDKTLQEYATIQYVQDYLEQINVVTTDNVESIIDGYINDSIAITVNEIVDSREATIEQINKLFNDVFIAAD